jgi:hypothetical protein
MSIKKTSKERNAGKKIKADGHDYNYGRSQWVILPVFEMA